MIESREDLVSHLTEAAGIEHALLCLYLYAAFSIKSGPDEGDVSWSQAQTIQGWKHSLLLIARQEMEHLGYVCNLLTAVGAAPHFGRPDFPVESRFFPHGQCVSLEPLSMTTLARMIWLEHPTHEGPTPGSVTLDEHYGAIREAFERIDERELFVDAAEMGSGLGAAGFDSKELAGLFVGPVTDRASALAAIDHIVAEGEGKLKDGQRVGSGRTGSHLDRLHKIRGEYERELKRARPFVPHRPMVHNPLASAPIAHPGTYQVVLLFDLSYTTMLLLLQRFYGPSDESQLELDSLQDAVFWPLMTKVIRPLGDLLARMPATLDPEGPTAGPAFQLDGIELPTRKRVAWPVIGQRLQRAAAYGAALDLSGSDHGPAAEFCPRLRELVAALTRVSGTFEGALAGQPTPP